jgi:hypothetical protein
MPFSGGILFGYGKDTACFFSTSSFKNKFIHLLRELGSVITIIF